MQIELIEAKEHTALWNSCHHIQLSVASRESHKMEWWGKNQYQHNNVSLFFYVKFIYSEKATKFCEISTLIWSVCTVDKSKVEISQNFVAFSEYTNLNENPQFFLQKT